MPSGLLQVVNSLFQTCYNKLGTSSASTTCWQLVNRRVTTCLQTCYNLCVWIFYGNATAATHLYRNALLLRKTTSSVQNKCDFLRNTTNEQRLMGPRPSDEWATSDGTQAQWWMNNVWWDPGPVTDEQRLMGPRPSDGWATSDGTQAQWRMSNVWWDPGPVTNGSRLGWGVLLIKHETLISVTN
jgi:hypothetical protein